MPSILAVAAPLRISAEAAQAVRAAIGREVVVGIRISQGQVNDFTTKWGGQAEADEIGTLLGQRPSMTSTQRSNKRGGRRSAKATP